MRNADDRRLLLWFLVAYAPFLLNDVLLIRYPGWDAFLLIDYGARVLTIAILVAVPVLRRAAFTMRPLAVGWRDALLLALFCIAAERLLDAWLLPVLKPLFAATELFRFPVLPDRLQPWDLSLGMLVVAISEELLCRRVAKAALQPWLGQGWALIAVASLLFGAMHWSQGVAAILYTGLVGAVLMRVYLATGALWPLVLAHDLIDVVSFW